MAEFDHGIKLIASTAGRELARVAGVQCDRWEPLESTLQATTEMLADRVFRARQGRERFVVYFEFYTTWNPDARWDILAKAGLLSQREHLPTVSIMFVLRRRGYRSQGEEFQLTVGGQPTQQIWFRERCLWRLEPQDWWEDVPALMALYPLSRHGRQPAEAVRFAAEVIERRVENAGQREDDLVLLSVFGDLAYPRLDVAGIIGRQKMEQSKFLREVRLATRREDVLDLVEDRLGSQARAAVEPAVNAITDSDELRRLLYASSRCSNLSEFQAALPQPVSSRRPGRRR